jgi:hypothetical protein
METNLWKPTYQTIGLQMIQTVDENKSYYSQRQVERARKARDLLHTLGCPSIQDLKKIISMNSIQNCPVTIEHINIAEQIYDKDIASIKGKTVRKKPPPAIQDIVEIPEELITHLPHLIFAYIGSYPDLFHFLILP